MTKYSTKKELSMQKSKNSYNTLVDNSKNESKIRRISKKRLCSCTFF